jgi:prolyl-tRNA editing enzyme YbaK/EbsC (Cys-tRNA(Pro) deacylase)
MWLVGVSEEMEEEYPALPRVFETLRRTIESVPSSWRQEIDRYVLTRFIATLRLAATGQIELSPGQYYQAIYDEMDRASDPCEISAVATLASAFWTDDRDQCRYITKNIDAVRRGASIRRLFVVSDVDWPKLYPVIRQQLEVGISIRRARRTILAEATALEDMVVYLDQPGAAPRIYITDHFFDNPAKIKRARLVLDIDDRGALLEAFERVWSTASVVTPRDLKEAVTPDQFSPEPGPNMKEYSLATPVVTCAEAASAKGIALANEVKTLLLSTTKGFVALHLPGDAEAALRCVKNALEVREARLASPDELKELGLVPGTVCAVKDPIWSLPHLISKRVLQMDMVSTNNGTHRGFYRFHPSVLLEASSVMIGAFELGGENA